MKKLIWICLALLPLIMPAQDLLTVAETSNYTRTSLYGDVINFIYAVQKKCDLIKVVPLAVSSEGRMIPLVIISQEGVACPKDLKRAGKSAILIMANIHAGEIEGKEACQMLLREFADKKLTSWLEQQVILMIPIFNPDGNEKLGKNRGDNGPELAGMRPNGQNLDLNRDYIKLESPEVTALVRLFNTWDPVAMVDMHTTNGSYHRHNVTWTMQASPLCDPVLKKYAWETLYPSVTQTMKAKYNVEPIPYGNFDDRLNANQGWANDAFEARYGTNYVGLRNRFAILDENYSHADFKSRVTGSLALIKSILEYSAANLPKMRALADESDRRTMQAYYKDAFVLDYKIEKLFDFTLKSYVFERTPIKPEERNKYPPWMGDYIVKRTDTLHDYTLPYLDKTVANKTRPLPAGYIVAAAQNEVIEKLKAHGVTVEKILEPLSCKAENFKIDKIELEKTIYQGHIALTLTGKYEPVDLTLPANAYYVSMQQPLARLIAIMLEPDNSDSLASWGFFNRAIVHQWSNAPGVYPIYRVAAAPLATMLVEQ